MKMRARRGARYPLIWREGWILQMNRSLLRRPLQRSGEQYACAECLGIELRLYCVKLQTVCIHGER
jgi:hypothetical protein